MAIKWALAINLRFAGNAGERVRIVCMDGSATRRCSLDAVPLVNVVWAQVSFGKRNADLFTCRMDRCRSRD